MNKLLYLIILILPVSVSAESLQTILYINGIQNKDSSFFGVGGAVKTSRKIKKLLKNEITNREFLISYLYNPIGFDGDTDGPDLNEDLEELFISKSNEEEYLQNYPFLYAPHNQAPSLNKNKANEITSFIDKELSSIQKPIEDGKKVLASQIFDKVIIVSHSQGNIIANYLWFDLVSKYGNDAFSKARIINIANTTLFSPNNLNFTHAGDGALFHGEGGLLCYNNSLENLPVKKEWIRNTPSCSLTDSNGICSFKISEATFNSSKNLIYNPLEPESSTVDQTIDNCLNHSMVLTYLSQRDVETRQGQDISFISGNKFKNRFVDFIQTAADSLDRANDDSEVSITAQLPSSVSVGEVPTFTGIISSEHPITSLTITTKLPDRGVNTDGSTQTLLGCPEGVFGDCTGFDESNTGEIDLSFVTFAQHYFEDLGEYPITIHAENSFGKKSSADFTITVIPKVDSVSVSPNPVDVGGTFKLSVSGKKLTEDVKAYVVGGSECNIATPTNEVFVEFDCTAQSEGELTYVVYYKEQATELYKDTVLAGTPSVCTEGQTDTQSCSAIANGTNAQTRTCLANGQWGVFGSCSINCNSGYHIESATCVADDTSIAGTENFQALGNTLSTNTTTPETGEIYRSFYGINTETNSEHVLLQDGVQFVSIKGDVNLTDAQVTDNARARVALELKLKSESTGEIATFFLAFDERVAGVKSRTYFASSTTPNGDTVGGEIPIVGLHKVPLTKGTAVKYKIELINDGTNFARVWLDDVSTLLPLSFLPTNDFQFYQAHFMTYVKNANVGDFVKGTIDNVVLKYTENGVDKVVEQNFSTLDDGRLPSAGDIFNRVEYVQTGSVQVCSPTATETRSCPIENGTGSQTRSCAIDGLSWGDYGACELQSCNTGYNEENGACIPTSTELSFDFSSDPNWITDQSSDYYWNSLNQTYHATTRNERPIYTPNRFAYIDTNLDVTKSFNLSWDMKIVNVEGYGLTHFGLIGNAVDHKHNFIGIGLGANSTNANIETTDILIFGNDRVGLGQSNASNSDGFMNEWIHCDIQYDSIENLVIVNISRVGSGEVEFTKTFALPPSFTFNSEMTKLGFAHDPFDYNPNVTFSLSSNDFQKTEIDNVVLVQDGIRTDP